MTAKKQPAENTTPPGIQAPDGRYLTAFAQRLAQAVLDKHRRDYEIGKLVDEAVRGYYWLFWPQTEGGPYKTMPEWAWAVLHFKHNKAYSLRQIYLALSALQPSELTLARSLRIGWTKLLLILRVARTEDALIAWIDRIETHRLTELDLRVETKIAAGEADEAEAPALEEPADPVPTPRSKHGMKSRRRAQDEAAAAALEHAPEAPPERTDGRPPLYDTPKVRRTKWPLVFEDDEALRIFKDGLKVIAKRYPDAGPGRAAALMATHYMATAARDDEGGAVVELEVVLQALEKTYGVRLQVLGPAPKRQRRAEAAQDF